MPRRFHLLLLLVPFLLAPVSSPSAAGAAVIEVTYSVFAADPGTHFSVDGTQSNSELRGSFTVRYPDGSSAAHGSLVGPPTALRTVTFQTSFVGSFAPDARVTWARGRSAAGGLSAPPAPRSSS